MTVPAQTTAKSETTRARILEAALELFRTRGFDSATMREIAAQAGVATGAAYYYFQSKEDIVMAFYRNAAFEMRPLTDAVIGRGGEFDDCLRQAIQAKLDYFLPNRSILRALLRNGADSQYPLSPFSAETREIREADTDSFRRLLHACAVRLPGDLAPHLPGVLWLYQMGIILLWVTDSSPRQSRTRRVLELSSRVVASLVRLAGLPLTRPLRRTAVELIEAVKGS
jgi:AcrR family transcriptional regulator